MVKSYYFFSLYPHPLFIKNTKEKSKWPTPSYTDKALFSFQKPKQNRDGHHYTTVAIVYNLFYGMQVCRIALHNILAIHRVNT